MFGNQKLYNWKFLQLQTFQIWFRKLRDDSIFTSTLKRTINATLSYLASAAYLRKCFSVLTLAGYTTIGDRSATMLDV